MPLHIKKQPSLLKDTVYGKILARASYWVGKELNEVWKGN